MQRGVETLEELHAVEVNQVVQFGPSVQEPYFHPVALEFIDDHGVSQVDGCFHPKDAYQLQVKRIGEEQLVQPGLVLFLMGANFVENTGKINSFICVELLLQEDGSVETLLDHLLPDFIDFHVLFFPHELFEHVEGSLEIDRCSSVKAKVLEGLDYRDGDWVLVAQPCRLS